MPRKPRINKNSAMTIEFYEDEEEESLLLVLAEGIRGAGVFATMPLFEFEFDEMFWGVLVGLYFIV